MAKYNVWFTKAIDARVEVTANSKEEAIQKAEDLFYSMSENQKRNSEKVEIWESDETWEFAYADKEEKMDISKTCEPVLGFNTKQWFVYCSEKDVYIDPPVEVLENIKKDNSNVDTQEKLLADIISKNPSWLYDEEYWYDGEETEI